ncbi:MAG TPA: hypothetical protein IAB40_06335 [Candidatus Onthocola stercoravium]|nr:hypothetical protein [Candidatus Onthocola stercoravium]
MYEIIKNVILSKNFKLEDLLSKIDVIWLQSKLSDEEKQSLIDLVRENALVENSYKPLQEQIDTLYTKLEDMDTRIKALENGSTEEPSTEPTEPVEDEYPEYVQPNGAHDAYNEGDKITYNGKKYVCKMKGCVWNPEAYPAGWER